MDEYVNKNTVVAYMMWAVVVAAMALAWVVVLVGEPKIAGMLAATGCATSALAATLHIRCYFTRIASLVRTSAGLGVDQLERPTGLRGL